MIMYLHPQLFCWGYNLKIYLHLPAIALEPFVLLATTSNLLLIMWLFDSTIEDTTPINDVRWQLDITLCWPKCKGHTQESIRRDTCCGKGCADETRNFLLVCDTGNVVTDNGLGAFQLVRYACLHGSITPACSSLSTTRVGRLGSLLVALPSFVFH